MLMTGQNYNTFFTHNKDRYTAMLSIKFTNVSPFSHTTILIKTQLVNYSHSYDDKFSSADNKSNSKTNQSKLLKSQPAPAITNTWQSVIEYHSCSLFEAYQLD